MKSVLRMFHVGLLIFGASHLPSPAQSIYLNAGALDTSRAAKLTPARAVAAEFSGRQLHLVQFDGPIQPEWVMQLEQSGYRIVDYIPDNAYLVYGGSSALQSVRAGARHVLWEGAYLASDKINPRARPAAVKARQAVGETGNLFAIQLVGDEAANAETLALVETMKLAPVRSVAPNEQLGFLNVIVALPTERIEELAERPDVVSINTWAPPRPLCERQGQIVAGNLNAAGSQPSGVGYLAWLGTKGFTQTQFDSSGFIVDIADDGWDNGVAASPANREFRKGGDAAQASRMKYSRNSTTLAASGSHGADGHGNLNIGIVGGYNNLTGSPNVDSAGYHRGLGICPFANLGNTKVFADGGTWDPTDAQEAAFIATNYSSGVRISSDSWGSTGDGSYDVSSQNYDTWTRDSQPAVAGNQQVLFVFAAGNDGSGAGTIGPPGSGKNIVSVGAAENYNQFGTDGCDVDNTGADNANDIIDFSSRGPCDDKRIKPDIVAPGTHVHGPASFYSGYTGDGVCDKYQPAGQTNYAASSGTSHSTPAVAGGSALVYQYFINQGWGAPSPAMVKAYLMNAARYMAGVYANDTLPSNNQGMGAMNLGTAFDGTPRILRDQLTNDLFTASGQSRKFYGLVADANKPVRVTLGWTDAPGSTTGNAYKNNLDLVVTVGGVAYKGNVFTNAFSKSGGAADLRNNVESVFLPAGATGLVQVAVTAFNINSDGVPNHGGALDQDFVLVVANATAFTPSNYPPALDPIGNKTMATNRLMQFAVAASDPVDNDVVRLWADGVPAWATFTGATNTGAASSSFSGTTPAETNTFAVTFYAADKDGTNSESIVITVNDVNCLPANLLTANFDDSTSVPTGWVDGGTANDTASHYQSAPNCRALGLGDTLQTPPVNNPTQIVFYVDASSKGSGQTASVDYKVGGGDWTELGTFVVSTAGGTQTFDLTGTPNLAETTDVSFRFNSTFNTWYLDDVAINGLDCGGAAVNHAPEISVAGGTSQSATMGAELAFVVTVNDADADVVTLQTNAAPAGAKFPTVVGPAPVQSTFVWTPAATGSFAAVFTASDGKVGATQTVSIAVGAPAPQLLAPVVLAASDVLGTQFNANWLASSNATGYRLDVATNGSFSSGGAATVLSEDFAGFTVVSGSTDRAAALDTYLHAPGWTGSKIYEDAGRAKIGTSSAKGYIVTPTVDLSGNGGDATLTFDLGQYGTDVGAVQVLHAPDGTTFSPVGDDLIPPAAMTAQTIPISGGTAASKIQIAAKGLSKNRFNLDNVQVAAGTGGAGSYVAGYQNRDVANLTTETVTGLTESVTYYYRVKAYNATSNSPYSGVTNVTTAAAVDVPPVLGAIGSKSVVVGSNLQFQVSATPTDADAVTLTASNLPGGATFNSTNENGTFLWIDAAPTGVYSVTFYATDKDGSDSETIAITVQEPVFELLAPVIQAASLVQATQFNANWLASAGATGYRLDVGTNATFLGGDGAAPGTNCYHNGTLGAGTGGTWTETGLTQGSGYLVSLAGDVLITPALDFTGSSAETLTFRARTYGGVNAATNTITVSISTNNGTDWAILGTRVPPSSTLTAMTPFDLSSYDYAQVLVKFETLAASATVGAGLDDVLVTNLTGAGSAAYVPGFENRDVGNATTYAVTGLTENATYYYRVKAYTATSNSPYSGTTNVTTTAGVNVPPVLGAIGNKSVALGSNLQFQVSATPTDADAVTLTASNMPAGATFNATNENGTFLWIGASPTGTYAVTFTATDKDGSDSETISITVGEASSELLAPVIQAASGVQATQFNANWLASANATGYRLDVATNEAFRHLARKATSALNPGDLTIVTVNADTNSSGKGFDAVPLVDLDAGTVIYFTDNGWTNGIWRATEGIVTYTAPDAITAGTVLSYRSATANGFASNANFNLSTSGDTILAYQGNTNSPQFLFGVGWASAAPWISSGAVTVNNSMIPSALSTGAYTIVALGSMDNYQYNAANGTAGSKAALMQLVGSAANWSGDDASAFAKFMPDFTVGAGPAINDFVPGFENLDVANVTTHAVTGLTEGVTYYYRAKAYNASSNSPYSAVTSVVTSASIESPDIAGFEVPAGSTAEARVTTSVVGKTYLLEYTTDLTANPVSWTAADSEAGTGGELILQDENLSDAKRFYRIRVQ